jgi:hypothetical protein
LSTSSILTSFARCYRIDIILSSPGTGYVFLPFGAGEFFFELGFGVTPEGSNTPGLSPKSLSPGSGLRLVTFIGGPHPF